MICRTRGHLSDMPISNSCVIIRISSITMSCIVWTMSMPSESWKVELCGAFSKLWMRREPYLSFWGSVFEDYVAWLFEVYANASLNNVYPSPAYPNEKNKPICDLIVVCGSTAILIEAKLATCRTDIRYGGDYKTMKKYLEDKLVVGTNRPVGVAQLLTAVRKLAVLP